MTYRFIAPLSDGTLADFAIDGNTLHSAFEQFKATPKPSGWYAVWCGLRLAGHVVNDEDGVELVDLGTAIPSHANPFACGD